MWCEIELCALEERIHKQYLAQNDTNTTIAAKGKFVIGQWPEISCRSSTLIKLTWGKLQMRHEAGLRGQGSGVAGDLTVGRWTGQLIPATCFQETKRAGHPKTQRLRAAERSGRAFVPFVFALKAKRQGAKGCCLTAAPLSEGVPGGMDCTCFLHYVKVAFVQFPFASSPSLCKRRPKRLVGQCTSPFELHQNEFNGVCIIAGHISVQKKRTFYSTKYFPIKHCWCHYWSLFCHLPFSL